MTRWLMLLVKSLIRYRREMVRLDLSWKQDINRQLNELDDRVWVLECQRGRERID